MGCVAIVATILTMGTGTASVTDDQASPVIDGQACEAVTIVVNDAPMRCDVNAGDRIDVMLTGHDMGAHAAACDDMGGRAVHIPMVATLCQSVDY